MPGVLKELDPMNIPKNILVATALTFLADFAVSAERIEWEAHTPLTRHGTAHDYEPSRAGFNNEAARRSNELQSQPQGGSAWVNRTNQPRRTTTNTQTVRVDVRGVGGSVSRSTSSTESADEAALRRVQPSRR